MVIAAKPRNEEERLEALYSYDILNTPPDLAFDRIMQLAVQLCGTQYGVISLIDKEQLLFKAKRGIGVWASQRDLSFCSHAILQPTKPLLVTDAKKDVRFHDNPFVEGEPHVRSYLGCPLVNSEGYALGVICVFDSQPKEMSEEQVAALEALAAQVVTELELRKKIKGLQQAVQIIDKQNEALDRINETRAKLMSIVSHDVRNALSGLKSVITLFHEGDFSVEETVALVHQSEEEVDVSIEVLENLLKWSSSQLNSEGLHLQDINPHALAEEILTNSREALLGKNNVALNAIAPDFFIQADKEVLRFVFRNLVGNANKFCEGGDIKLQCETTEEGYTFSVSDTGMGMDEDRLARLFQYRPHTPQLGTRGEKGAGIGLQLCQDLLKKHAGNIKVKSKKGMGTTFSFFLPKDIHQVQSVSSANKSSVQNQHTRVA